MGEAPEKVQTNPESGGRFINTLIRQWMRQSGNNTLLSQTEQQVTEGSNMQENRRQMQHHQERTIQALQRKLKESQEVQASLSASLETETRNKEEIETKLTAVWESIETITQYCDYIRESLSNFQLQRVNLSALYDNIITKQQEAIDKLRLSNAKSKDLELHIVQLKNESGLQEEKLQKALVEQNKLREQLENSEDKFQLQRNELTKMHSEEKLMLVQEQQRLVLECENLQSRVQTIEKEKYDMAKLNTEVENKLLIKEQRIEEILTEQNKLREQLQHSELEFYSQKNHSENVYAEEKRMLVEEQQRLLTNCEGLQTQLKMLEQENNDIIKGIAERDEILSKLREANSTYKNKIEAANTDNNEMNSKHEALVKQQNALQDEIRKKMEKIQKVEAMLSSTKHREAGLLNDINRIEKKLNNEMELSKKFENKLSDAKKELRLSQMQNAEVKKDLEMAKLTNELSNNELQQKIQNLQKEKEEVIKQESRRVKDAEILYENTQMKHAEEMSILKNSYEMQLLELRKTIKHSNETICDIKKENSVLNVSLTEMRMEHNDLKNKYRSIMECNNNLQEQLETATEVLHSESSTDQKPKNRNQKQPNIKRKYEVWFAPEIEEISEVNECKVSTSVDSSKKEQDKSLSQPLNRISSTQRENQQEQKIEVVSVGKKFFKSRSTQPRTYTKRR